MKRRKKAPQQGTGTPAQAPLQPAYFDTTIAPQAPVAEPSHAEAGEPQPEAQEAREAPAAQAAEGGNGEGTRRRRRRRRGGRGRGRGPAQAAEAAPATEALGQAVPEESAPTAVAEPVTPAPARVPQTAARPAAAARPPKGVVVLAIGLPGSGKSSWFKRHSITPLSSDLLRALLFDDPSEQRYQDLIFSNLRSMLKARLIARRPLNYVDATNLTPHERHSWIKLAKDFGYEVQAVFFDVPVEVCLERNQRRQRVVPEDVMRRMAAKLRPPTFEEGFAKITVVRVKHKP
ncbi:MAG TPA: AAA family ATPase [Terriglobales bacterium]|nr:AAA family ATPase [Terriglobales bacterium]